MSEDILQNMITSVEVTSTKQIIFQGEAILEYYNFLPVHEIADEWLIETLQRLFYKHFYVVPSTPKILPDKANQKAYLKKLRLANRTRSRWQKGWEIEYVNTNGSVVVTLNGERRLARVGEFILENSYHKPLKVGEQVRIFCPKEYAENAEGFYHVFGEILSDNFQESEVRFYFNLLPDGAPLLIKSLTIHLNLANIPFHFKCLQHPFLYNRVDAGVLYVSRRYFFELMPILWQIYEEVEPYLAPDVPLFTLALGKGFGFAETPTADSFGMHRCKLFATALVELLSQKNGVSLSLLQEKIEQQGYDFSRLYLNQNSRFPYQFGK